MVGSRRNRGFTLVELLVVVSVIAMLTVLAAPKISSVRQEARQAQAQHDLQAIHVALERHFVDRGHYPLKLNDLIERGYLKKGFAFRSALSPRNRFYYFYTVDDNRDDQSPRAYALGVPDDNAGSATHLYHKGPLPRGRRTDYRAYAWLLFNAGQGLNLYAADDSGLPLPPGAVPLNLGDYRSSCQPTSPEPNPGPCDLIAN